MGSFWIFFLFIGIVALVKRKELATNDNTSTSNAPTDAEKSEIERRIKEIFGEVEQQQKVAPTSNMHPAMPQTPKPTQTTTKPTAIRSSKVNTSTTSRVATKSQQSSKLSPNIQKNHSNKPTEANSEVERIVEDFSLEKAVIYAEILEPKFKEY